MKKAFLLFWGYNERAVLALLRYFTHYNVDFYIVTPADDDQIERSIYANKIIYKRCDSTLTAELFQAISEKFDGQLIYCPTTEFLNKYLLENRINENIKINLPTTEVYEKLTSKLLSQEIVKNIPGIYIPKTLTNGDIKTPYVLKPRRNISSDKTFYPYICLTQKDFCDFSTQQSLKDYFAQEYIDGESYYLCGYLTKDKKFFSYWQKNLLQQGNGKSIILAKTCTNPGLDEKAYIETIHGLGFFGPIMIELMKRQNKLYYIEINPRFWGPLHLSVTNCPDLLGAFVTDNLGMNINTERKSSPLKYYSWSDGLAGNQHPRKYCIIQKKKLERILKVYDIYSKEKYSDLI